MIWALSLVIWTTSQVAFGDSAMATNEQVVQALQDLQARLAIAEAAAQQSRDDNLRLQQQLAAAIPAGGQQIGFPPPTTFPPQCPA